MSFNAKIKEKINFKALGFESDPETVSEPSQRPLTPEE